MKILQFFSNLYNSFISIIKIILKSNFFIKPNKVNDNKNCFVLANGPTLEKNIEENEELLKKSNLFAVNFFTQSAYFQKLKPNNYVILDSGFFENFENQQFINFNETFRDKVNWKMNFYVPIFAKKSKFVKDYLKKNSNINIIFYNYTVYNGFENFGHFLYKKNLCMPQCQNIVKAALFQSLQAGYEKTCLFGAENSWPAEFKVNEKNEVFFYDKHIYDKDNVEKTFRIIPGKLHDQMLSMYKLFMGYHKIEAYSKHLNRKIYNASYNSYIDAFTRIKKEDINQLMK